MGEKVKAGKVGDFKEGIMREVDAADRVIIVLRLGDKWYAADARCPHKKGRLVTGKLEGTVVTCPLHGSKFDLKDGSVLNYVGITGIALKAASRTGLAKSINAYRVEVEGENVTVEI
jgi:3-phenylpropionate/trans-cinnamate dioxygenase ferredoxin subunit